MPMTTPRGRSSLPGAWNNHFHLKSPFAGREGFGMPVRTATPTRQPGRQRSSTPGRRIVAGIPVRGSIDHRVNSHKKAELLRDVVKDEVMAVSPAPKELPVELEASPMEVPVQVAPAADAPADDLLELSPEEEAQTETDMPTFRGFADAEVREEDAHAQEKNVFNMPTSDLIARYHQTRRSLGRSEFDDVESTSLMPPKAAAAPVAVAVEAPKTVERSARKSVTWGSPLTDMKHPVNTHASSFPTEDASSCTSLTLSPEVSLCTRKRLSYSVPDTPADVAVEDVEMDVCSESESDSVGWSRDSRGPRAISMESDGSLIEAAAPAGVAEAPHSPSPAEQEDTTNTVDVSVATSPSQLSYRDLQKLAFDLDVPNRNAKRSKLEAAIRKVLFADNEAEAEAPAADLSAKTYRELQIMAKELGVSAAGPRAALEERVRAAQ
eukprot:TRINITY_DN32380_c0_g1_i1.p1 TRINITY_DN32380_c0_g1~~TRINITY_DN32380_c0_g1_i1.p1  ORF type:complete len:437 (+),score=110.71 TRINITY_DN32380_c0_g1_i1:59-1369(+)